MDDGAVVYKPKLQSPVNNGVVGQKISRVRSCNFPTDATKFRRNSNRKLQIV